MSSPVLLARGWRCPPTPNRDLSLDLCRRQVVDWNFCQSIFHAIFRSFIGEGRFLVHWCCEL